MATTFRVLRITPVPELGDSYCRSTLVRTSCVVFTRDAGDTLPRSYTRITKTGFRPAKVATPEGVQHPACADSNSHCLAAPHHSGVGLNSHRAGSTLR